MWFVSDTLPVLFSRKFCGRIRRACVIASMDHGGIHVASFGLGAQFPKTSLPDPPHDRHCLEDIKCASPSGLQILRRFIELL